MNLFLSSMGLCALSIAVQYSTRRAVRSPGFARDRHTVAESLRWHGWAEALCCAAIAALLAAQGSSVAAAVSEVFLAGAKGAAPEACLASAGWVFWALMGYALVRHAVAYWAIACARAANGQWQRLGFSALRWL